MKRVRFTKAAAKDLDEIYEHIGQDNLDAAVKHRRRLEKRWSALIDLPRIGRKRDSIKPGLRSVTEGNYVIFYRIAPDVIQVVRVLHAAQDEGQAFAEIEY